MNTMKLLISFLFLSLMFVSCDRDNVDDIDITEETEITDPEGELVDVNPLVGRSGGGSDDGLELECLTILYPFQLVDIDGNNISISGPSDFENLSEVEVIVDFVYPLNVRHDLDQEVTVDNSEELGELFIECWPDFEDFDEETRFPAYLISDETSCYELSYPITLEKVDESQITVGDEDEFVDALYSDFYFFVFPFSLIDEDGELVEITDQEVLFDVLIDCNDIDFSDSLDFSWDNADLACFQLVFPLDVVLSDGTVVTVENHEEYCDLMLIGTISDFSYPITVLDEDGTSYVLNDIDELNALISEHCDYWWDVGSDGFFELLILISGTEVQGPGIPNCYDINYPIEYTDSDDQTIAIDSDEDLINLISSAEFGLDIESLVYPIDVTLISDQSVSTVNNLEDIFAILEDCQ